MGVKDKGDRLTPKEVWEKSEERISELAKLTFEEAEAIIGVKEYTGKYDPFSGLYRNVDYVPIWKKYLTFYKR